MSTSRSPAIEEKVKNHLVLGENLVSRLKPADVERILLEIRTASGPVAKSIRNELVQRAADLQILLNDVETAVCQTHDLMQHVHADISGGVIAVARDCMSPNQRSPFLSEQKDDSETRMSTAKTVTRLQEPQHFADHADPNIPGMSSYPAEEFFIRGCHLVGLLPHIYSETIIAAIKTAETPLANLLRRKLKRQALEINSLIHLLDEAACACYELIQQAPPEVLESILLIQDSVNPVVMMIQDRLLAKFLPEIRNEFELAPSQCDDDQDIDKTHCPANLRNIQKRPDNTNVLMKEGHQLLGTLPFEDAKVVLENIKLLQTPVAKAIRRKLVLHKNELDDMLRGVEHAFGQSGPSLAPAGSDATSVAQVPSDSPQALSSPEASPGGPCASARKGSSLGCVDAAVESGRLLMGLLTPQSADAVSTALRQADKGLAVAVRQALRQHATGIGELLAAVDDVVVEGGEMLLRLPAEHVDTILDGLGGATGPAGTALRRSLAKLICTDPDHVLEVRAISCNVENLEESAVNSPTASPGPVHFGDSEVVQALDATRMEIAGYEEDSATVEAGGFGADAQHVAAAQMGNAPDTTVVVADALADGVDASAMGASAPATELKASEEPAGQASTPVLLEVIPGSNSELTASSGQTAIAVASSETEIPHIPVEAAKVGSGPESTLADPNQMNMDDARASPRGDSDGNSLSVSDVMLSAGTIDAIEGYMSYGQEACVLERGHVLLRLLPGSEAEEVLSRLGQRRTPLSRSLALRMVRDLPVAEYSDRDMEKGEGLRSGTTEAEESEMAQPGYIENMKVDDMVRFDMKEAGTVQQVLEEGLELVIRLPSDVVDGMLSLLFGAQAPLAATIRAQFSFDSNAVVEGLGTPLKDSDSSDVHQSVESEGSPVSNHPCCEDDVSANFVVAAGSTPDAMKTSNADGTSSVLEDLEDVLNSPGALGAISGQEEGSSSFLADAAVLCRDSVLDVVISSKVADDTEGLVVADGLSSPKITQDTIPEGSDDNNKDSVGAVAGMVMPSNTSSEATPDEHEPVKEIELDIDTETITAQKSDTITAQTSEGITECTPSCLRSDKATHLQNYRQAVVELDSLVLPQHDSTSALLEPESASLEPTAVLDGTVPILNHYEQEHHQQDGRGMTEIALLPVVENFPVGGTQETSYAVTVLEDAHVPDSTFESCEWPSVAESLVDSCSLQNVVGTPGGTELGNEIENSESQEDQDQVKSEQDRTSGSSSGEFDYKSDQENNIQCPPASCPRSDVALTSEAWTPQPNLPSTFSSDFASVQVPEYSSSCAIECLPTSEPCPSLPEVKGSEIEIEKCSDNSVPVSCPVIKPKHQLALDPRPRAMKALKHGIEDALSNLRKFLHMKCKQKGICDADHVVSRLIRAADSDGKNHLSASGLANALSFMHVHLRKYLIRPLKANAAYFEDGYLKVDDFLEALNSEQWWPLQSDFEDNQDGLEKLFQELRAKFGPKISAALVAGQNVDHLRSLLIEAERDESALQEMRAFVDDRIQKQSIEDIFAKSLPLETKPIKVSQVSSNDGIRQSQTFSPYSCSVHPFLNPRLSRCTLKRDEKYHIPKRCSSVDLATTLPQASKQGVQPFQRFSDGSGGQNSDENALSKTDIFVGSGYLPALSRKRGEQYAKKISGHAVDNTARFWQKLPFPMHAVKYKRWCLLNDPVLPGFSDPNSVLLSKPDETWECPKKSDAKCGSRFRESFSIRDSIEVLDKYGMQNADLKNQRLNSKLVLQGDDLLREVKKLVMRSDFDGALHSAASALQNFKLSGISGVRGAQELGEPIQYVACNIKSQIEKRIKISQSQLDRGNFEKALEHIPFLLHATRWISKLKRYEQSVNSICFPNIVHEAKLIDDLTGKIIDAQRESALLAEAASLSSYFASVKEEFDADGTLTSERVDLASKRRNMLPDTIIADGRAYVMVLDAKPADMPAKFQLGTKLKIQGAGVLGSGRRDDGSKARFGTVTAFNESSSKYKIQYPDDYEWMSWPHTGHYMVEIDIYPEDVEIEIPGFYVQSKTINLMRSTPQNEAGLIMVVFAVTPVGLSLESSPFGRLSASVTGVKSGKSLLDSTESGIAQVLPPLFLLPSSRYLLFDAVHNQRLDQGVAEFVHVGNKQKFVFACGQEVIIPHDGVYQICFKGQTHFDSPTFTYSHKTCIVLNEVNKKYISDISKVFLNEPLLQKDELRIIVSWNSEPLEIDLHIYTSSGEHFSDEGCVSDSSGDVKIEMDSVAGFGPETVTIRIKPNQSYSLSLCLCNINDGLSKWDQCNATVCLYNYTGIFSMFNLPPSKHSNITQPWWHVFALDGSKWGKPGHGLLRVNKLMADEMPQLALPGWRIIHAASHGLWDEFRDVLLDLFHNRIQNDRLMMVPLDISNSTSLRGETILGLMCLHNEDEGEDPSHGNEEGETPLQKQIDSAKKFLNISQRHTSIAESMLNGGLPTYETFARECKLCGLDDCYIFRAVSYASTDLTLLILNILNSVVKRSLPGHGYRNFFENHGETLLLECIKRRSWQSVLPVLRCILSIEAVWQRRCTRKFRKSDCVQVEIPAGSGKWLNGIVSKKNNNLYEVVITKISDVQVQEEADCDTAASEQATMSDVSSSQLRWRSKVVDYLKTKCARNRDRPDSTQFQAHSLAGVSFSYKGSSQIDAVFSEALVLLSDKMAPSPKSY